eukprot:TRINITY_DN5825_c0_g2_i3.p1 TRINITY_DN5825_c0_g2~~TRINITY_DN5825_c0_g2_i3.p1  ORF type:complete len:463 (+),score=77.08 TRINITY_DN5825_c0_g2_i3:62-1450(+)
MSSDSTTSKPTVVIVGAGIVGVTSAFFLSQKGFNVTVIEKSAEPADYGGASYQNGGLICPGLVAPWSYPGAWKAVLSSYHKSSPFKLRWGSHWCDPALWRWLRLFLYYSAVAGQKNYEERTSALVQLADHSMKEYKGLLGRYPSLVTPNVSVATLALYGDQDACVGDANLINKAREEHSLPPVLTITGNISTTIKDTWMNGLQDQDVQGAIIIPADTSGNCNRFTKELEKICKTLPENPVSFHYGQVVEKVRVKDNKIVELETKEGIVFNADTFLLATGARTDLLKLINFYLPLIPIKGFSLDIPLKEEFVSNNHLPEVSFTVDGSKFFASRIGNSLRVSAFAEIAGFDSTLREDRREQMENWIKHNYDWEELDMDSGNYYTCHRPVSPDDIPYVGKVKPFKNLFLNMGHGSLGWTLACGTSSLSSQLIAGETPVINATPYLPNRFDSWKAKLARSMGEDDE